MEKTKNRVCCLLKEEKKQQMN